MKNHDGKARFKQKNTIKTIWMFVIALGFVSSYAQACPDFTQDGVSISYTSDQLYSPKSHKVVAGGNVDLGSCWALPGYGYVMTAPDFTLNFSNNAVGRALEFRLDTDCDSILLVNDANGIWHYDDDSNGLLDAKLRLSKAANGIYDIWVGTRFAGNCNATLILETF